jgi:hypothetical protein
VQLNSFHRNDKAALFRAALIWGEKQLDVVSAIFPVLTIKHNLVFGLVEAMWIPTSLFRSLKDFPILFFLVN